MTGTWGQYLAQGCSGMETGAARNALPPELQQPHSSAPHPGEHSAAALPSELADPKYPPSSAVYSALP